jgi:hypothetical protein
MIAPIIFPDVELWLTGYLRDALSLHGFPGVFVSNRRESQTVAVWVRRDGGAPVNQVLDYAQVGINVFHAGSTDEAVSRLARLTSALLRSAADGKPVCRVEEVMGPSPVADSLPRRYMTFALTLRGVEL